MNVNSANQALLDPNVNPRGALPHLVELRRRPWVFNVQFGLDRLPEEPGLILVRGARQYGKSTWLEGQIATTIEQFGPGSALYLNGDELATERDLVQAIRATTTLFAPTAPVRRLFIDEITSVAGWERALKTVIDAGELRGVLIVTTGSRATDLRRGAERLPGRKGRLERTGFLFTPVPYHEFRRVCGDHLGTDTLVTYLLAGGSPVACAELAHLGRLPEYVPELVRDWIRGECAASGRNRASILAVMEQLHRQGGSAIGQAKLARDAGLANNTVAAGYLELLADLMVVGIARAWDPDRGIAIRRRPAKFPFLSLLAAIAWGRDHLRSVDDFRALPPTVQGRYWEWLVAQELWRRAAIRGDDLPEELAYWSSREHEIDYVASPQSYIEVKLGQASPLEFTWFARTLPNIRLTVITSTPFATDAVTGITMEQFLLEGESTPAAR